MGRHGMVRGGGPPCVRVIYERGTASRRSGSPIGQGEVADPLSPTGEPKMLYPGIDQHARQITVSLRAEDGDVLQARQESTQPEKVNAFFQQLTRDRLGNGESFV